MPNPEPANSETPEAKVCEIIENKLIYRRYYNGSGRFTKIV